MVRPLLLLICVFSVVSTAGLPAEATTSVTAGGSCSLATGGGTNPVPCGTYLSIPSAPPGAVASAAGDWIDPRIGTANSAGWSSSAGFGLLRSASYAAASTVPPSGMTAPLDLGVVGSSVASAGDDIIFDAPGLTGQPGFVTASILLEGTMSVATTSDLGGSARSNWDLSARVIANGQLKGIGSVTGSLQLANGVLTGQPAVSQLLSFTTPIVFGQTNLLSLSLGTWASANARPPGTPGSPGYDTPVNSSAAALFSNTAAWQGFHSVTLANGTAVQDWSVSSTSGVDYSQPVPEPGTGSLVLLGVLGLAARAGQNSERT